MPSAWVFMWMFFALTFFASMFEKLEEFRSIELAFNITFGMAALFVAFAFMILMRGCRF